MPRRRVTSMRGADNHSGGGHRGGETATRLASYDACMPDTPESDTAYIRLDLDITVTDPQAVEDAAIAHIRAHQPAGGTGQEVSEDEEFVRGSLDDALIYLIAPERAIEGVPGVELLGSITGPFTPRERRPAGPTSTMTDEEFIASILRQGELVHGIDHVWDDDEDEDDDDGPGDGEPDPHARPIPTRTELLLLKGMLFHAARFLIDQLFEDLRTLNGLDQITAADIDNTGALSGLPPRFADLYTVQFTEKFLVSTVEVSHRLTRGWHPLATVAEELALRLLLDQTESSASTFGIPLPDGWRPELEDALFEDTDHEILYGGVLSDLLDELHNNGDPDELPLAFNTWFVPFNIGYRPSPYAQDLPETETILE